MARPQEHLPVVRVPQVENIQRHGVGEDAWRGRGILGKRSGSKGSARPLADTGEHGAALNTPIRIALLGSSVGSVDVSTRQVDGSPFVAPLGPSCEVRQLVPHGNVHRPPGQGRERVDHIHVELAPHAERGVGADRFTEAPAGVDKSVHPTGHGHAVLIGSEHGGPHLRSAAVQQPLGHGTAPHFTNADGPQLGAVLFL